MWNSNERVAFTVAIPTYNRAYSVSLLLRSVVEQTVDSDEIIVSDDGSTDDTVERLLGIKGVQLLRAHGNQGMVSNWNRCLESGSRDWVRILHDDDLLQPGALEALRYACALVGEPALVMHNYRGDDFGGAFRCTVSRPCGWSVLNCPTIPSGVVVHRSIVEAVGKFDHRFKYSADMEYFARIAARFSLLVTACLPSHSYAAVRFY